MPAVDVKDKGCSSRKKSETNERRGRLLPASVESLQQKLT
jgi:hypothetical protein